MWTTKERCTAVRTALAFSLALAAAVPLSADEAGVKGGATRSTFFPSGAGWDAGTGFQAGAFYERPLTSRVSVRPELFVARRVTTSESVGPDIAFGSALRLDYLEMPVVLVRSFGTSDRLRPELFAGAYVATRLSARLSTEAAGHALDEDFAAEVERHDAGFVAGGALRLRRWLAELRYTAGLRRADTGWLEERAKNRSFAVLAGLRF
ncbi:MAG TPA: porin family protein [Vicinamibacterales bacterium]|nr:porin family protein [Vicinamibacterales bacterium]